MDPTNTTRSCLVGLGANLGEPVAKLDEAVNCLRAQFPDADLKVSPWYRTRAVGGGGNQPDYANGAVSLQTQLSAQRIVEQLLNIEHDLGRQRQQRWSARTIDLDLLLLGDVFEQDLIRVPHPWLPFRKFALQPANDVVPNLIHPATGWTVNRLWQHAQRRPLLIAVEVAGDENNDDHGTMREENVVVLSSIQQRCLADPSVHFVDDDLETDFNKRSGQLRQLMRDHASHRALIIQRPLTAPSHPPLPDDIVPNATVKVCAPHHNDLARNRTKRCLATGPYLEINVNTMDEMLHDLLAVIDGLAPAA